MRELKLKWQLFPSNVIILICAMMAVAWYGTHSLKEFYIDQMAAFLEAESNLILPDIKELATVERLNELYAFCKETGKKISTRITVIEPDGTVICDSERDYRSMQNHANRPEIKQALGGNPGTSRRYSTTTRQQMLYVAIPIRIGKEIKGVLRASKSLTAIDGELQSLFARIIAGIIVVIAFASFFTLILARKISQPIEQMKNDSLRFAHGDFTRKILVSGPDEIVGLAQAMNSMAEQMDERMRTVLGKSKELETVLSSMLEGVIAVDLHEEILYMNGSAQKQLDIRHSDVKGKRLLEVVRNIELLRFIEQTLSVDEPTEKTILFNLGKKDERMLQIHGAQLVDAQKNKIGALVVTNDVTRLLRLENLRRDFVANVSHELRTPITSIKGYVETLLDEASEHSQHVQDFLEIISKQTNRLHAIVEDLLALAKIEQQSDREEVVLERGSIKEVLHGAIEACSVQAAEKVIHISLDCPDQTVAMINGPMLEQAVINLLDNALKYSNPESTVYIETETTQKNIIINVRDTGIGIAPAHLDRLFERFYVVDKGRSRDAGGTGLGLAIVKHIAQAHGGKVTVQSEPGKGSTFSILLPQFSF
jgi:two-component system phosphate regulon sensor histidine kinase PhoR